MTLRAFFEPPLSGFGDRNAAKLSWVVRLRWIALCAQALSIGPGLHFQLLEREILPVFAAIVAGLALVNLVTWRGLRRSQEVSQRHILLQLTADVVALSALLALTGGAWNPLFPLLFFHAGVGALLLEGRVSVEFIWILMASIVAVQILSQVPPGLAETRVEPLVLFPAQLLVAGLFYLLSSWLSHTLTSLQAHFHSLQEQRVRIDRLRAIGALAAGLCHELATPLNTGMLKLERLARKHDLNTSSDLRDALEALDRCEDVLRNMAGSQLRPEGLQMESANVADLVAQACRGASSEGANVEFFPPSADAVALVPPIAFTQAVLNLIDNACEASPPDRSVEVRVRGGREGVVIEVSDRGEGWPDVVREHLGEPFVTTRREGVGLGLYYVWTLASALGGELTLADREAGGAIARLSLPATTANRPEARA